MLYSFFDSHCDTVYFEEINFYVNRITTTQVFESLKSVKTCIIKVFFLTFYARIGYAHDSCNKSVFNVNIYIACL